MPNVVVLGIFVADCTFHAARLPHMEETLLGDGFALGPGGKGSNQAVAAGRLGADVSLITKIGDDNFGAMGRALWAKAGVSDSGVMQSPTDPTGAAFVFIQNDTGENAIIVTPGAAGRLTVEDVEAHRSLIEGARVFITQLEQPLPVAQRALEIAKAAGVTTILNPAPAPADGLSPELLALCDYITPNETEAQMLGGVGQVTPATGPLAASALRDCGANNVIITFGGDGAALYDNSGGTTFAPAVSAGPVVETTGAGDAFNGAFATALAAQKPTNEAMHYACCVAGISVTRAGAAASMPTADEVEQLILGEMGRVTRFEPATSGITKPLSH